MDTHFIPRSDTRLASIARQGIDWARTYGQRSAAAYLLFRNVPRPLVERILSSACRQDDRAP